ncbi:histidine phosphatase family protein [Sphingobacterium sp. ML3W]|uniref:SixA phosphatase family protein n=1 Tax=Sphingobacterium sp. ML3W TaxID=1538644 RepID=UPI00249B980C|nr:histidine phosphatase family protein [Sphingobacterium sp. ML3W]WFA78893.1 histidine phosphatase family protein [Sphingobacterium sp. ML3W]
MDNTKKLFIIRHAKAETIPGINDFDRSLTSEGIQHAKQVAAKLASTLTLNDKSMVISSPANRALQTTRIFLDILGEPSFDIQIEDSIYECTYKHLLSVINSIPDHIDYVLLIGHNPTLTDLVEFLTRKAAYLRTSSFAEIKLDAGFTFQMLSGNCADLVQIVD